MKQESLTQLRRSQKDFFETETTHCIEYRITQLKKLKNVIMEHEDAIIKALHADLKKSNLEAYFSAVHMCIKEIDFAIKNIWNWTKERRIPTPLSLWPMRSAVIPQAYGTVLIISTWNYPFNLSLLPLIGAITAGNCAVIKPSPRAPHAEKLLISIINATFESQYIAALPNSPNSIEDILNEQWDYIFFTGHELLGKKLMHNAAQHITPITLELGGKSPCIIDQTASLTNAAQKITWGKWMNAGQNCISPDYLLIHASIKDRLIEHIKKSITEFYGNDPQQSPLYGRLIDEQYTLRIQKFMEGTNIIYGGTVDVKDRYVAPTMVTIDSLDHPIMHEEIFGPILPIITFETTEQAINIYQKNPHPLAVYVFSHDTHTIETIKQKTASGAFGINELVLQVASHYLPFGGIGASGIGRYHGKASFDTFSNDRALIYKGWFDVPFRYPHYTNVRRWFRKILKWL